MKHTSGTVTMIKEDGEDKIYKLSGVKLSPNGKYVTGGNGLIFDDSLGTIEYVETKQSTDDISVCNSTLMDIGKNWIISQE